MHNQFNAEVKFNDKISDNLPFQKRCYVFFLSRNSNHSKNVIDFWVIYTGMKTATLHPPPKKNPKTTSTTKQTNIKRTHVCGLHVCYFFSAVIATCS